MTTSDKIYILNKKNIKMRIYYDQPISNSKFKISSEFIEIPIKTLVKICNPDNNEAKIIRFGEKNKVDGILIVNLNNFEEYDENKEKIKLVNSHKKIEINMRKKEKYSGNCCIL